MLEALISQGSNISKYSSTLQNTDTRITGTGSKKQATILVYCCGQVTELHCFGPTCPHPFPPPRFKVACITHHLTLAALNSGGGGSESPKSAPLFQYFRKHHKNAEISQLFRPGDVACVNFYGIWAMEIRYAYKRDSKNTRKEQWLDQRFLASLSYNFRFLTIFNNTCFL